MALEHGGLYSIHRITQVSGNLFCRTSSRCVFLPLACLSYTRTGQCTAGQDEHWHKQTHRGLVDLPDLHWSLNVEHAISGNDDLLASSSLYVLSPWCPQVGFSSGMWMCVSFAWPGTWREFCVWTSVPRYLYGGTKSNHWHGFVSSLCQVVTIVWYLGLTWCDSQLDHGHEGAVVAVSAFGVSSCERRPVRPYMDTGERCARCGRSCKPLSSCLVSLTHVDTTGGLGPGQGRPDGKWREHTGLRFMHDLTTCGSRRIVEIVGGGSPPSRCYELGICWFKVDRDLHTTCCHARPLDMRWNSIRCLFVTTVDGKWHVLERGRPVFRLRGCEQVHGNTWRTTVSGGSLGSCVDEERS